MAYSRNYFNLWDLADPASGPDPSRTTPFKGTFEMRTAMAVDQEVHIEKETAHI